MQDLGEVTTELCHIDIREAVEDFTAMCFVNQAQQEDIALICRSNGFYNVYTHILQYYHDYFDWIVCSIVCRPT